MTADRVLRLERDGRLLASVIAMQAEGIPVSALRRYDFRRGQAELLSLRGTEGDVA